MTDSDETNLPKALEGLHELMAMPAEQEIDDEYMEMDVDLDDLVQVQRTLTKLRDYINQPLDILRGKTIWEVSDSELMGDLDFAIDSIVGRWIDLIQSDESD
jgi:hypothetical protein